MAQTGQVNLLGTTYSDHMLSYFSTAFNIDNAALAAETLQRIYATAPSNNVFWTPERVVDGDVL